MSQPIATWYTIEFDAGQVRLSASPPGQQPWIQTFGWDEVERVCFEAGDFVASDTIYLFTRLRPESYVIPLEAAEARNFGSKSFSAAYSTPNWQLKWRQRLKEYFAGRRLIRCLSSAGALPACFSYASGR
jgi:hypothetical protein